MARHDVHAVDAAGRRRRPDPVTGAPPRRPRPRSVVDLTHVLTPDFPAWPGDRPFEIHLVSRFDPAGGEFFANELALHEHTGTHIDAPAHASLGGITVERIDPRDLVVPIAVIDIAARAAQDPDTLLGVRDILTFEREHGALPERCLVALHSGWAARVSTPGAFTNADADGVHHTPGFDPAAVQFLVRERNIVGIGTDTLTVDAGRSADYGAHVGVLGAGKYAVEVLANLDKIPPVGATVVVGAPTHAGGSGGPCRVFALL
ncbi:cyclase family protein [Speluncibacter jeojiensis]|uniref:cyclase family protein n=1 Tax=Speluncibacter jeojiensis TaxID=2710754 RepID=UPI0039F4C0F0